MDAPAHGRRITIWLSAESYTFVEKLIEAGFAGKRPVMPVMAI